MNPCKKIVTVITISIFLMSAQKTLAAGKCLDADQGKAHMISSDTVKDQERVHDMCIFDLSGSETACNGYDCEYLKEYYCDENDEIAYEKIKCDIGCFNGGCVTEEQNNNIIVSEVKLQLESTTQKTVKKNVHLTAVVTSKSPISFEGNKMVSLVVYNGQKIIFKKSVEIDLNIFASQSKEVDFGSFSVDASSKQLKILGAVGASSDEIARGKAKRLFKKVYRLDGRPDLIIEKVEAYDNGDGTGGIKVEYKNIGNAEAPAGYSVTVVNFNGTLVKGATQNSFEYLASTIGAGKRNSVKIPADSGSHRLNVLLDYSNYIDESDKDNNSLITEVVVNIQSLTKCYDYDEGENTAIKSHVEELNLLSGQSKTFYDFCGTGDQVNYVNEYSCNKGQAVATKKYCLNGCDKGACKNLGEFKELVRYFKSVEAKKVGDYYVTAMACPEQYNGVGLWCGNNDFTNKDIFLKDYSIEKSIDNRSVGFCRFKAMSVFSASMAMVCYYSAKGSVLNGFEVTSSTREFSQASRDNLLILKQPMPGSKLISLMCKPGFDARLTEMSGGVSGTDGTEYGYCSFYGNSNESTAIAYFSDNQIPYRYQEKTEDACPINMCLAPEQAIPNKDSAANLFVSLYKRIPTNDKMDQKAIKILGDVAGLKKMTNTEKNQSLKKFTSKFNRKPFNQSEQLMARSLLLVSVKSMKDRDQDYLPDELEIKYGTEISNQDSDKDGFVDGLEILAGFNPKGAGKLISK